MTISSTSPAAVIATPAHWRGPTWKPKIRSASTASITTPVESTACTTDIGASASAATCSSQAPAAIPIPSANHLERKSDFALYSGCRMSTQGASLAPRCL